MQLVFFTVPRKIFTNKNIFSKDVLCVLFETFFSKMYNKKHWIKSQRSPFKEGPIIERSKCCDWYLDKLLVLNFSKLMDSKQIYRNAFFAFFTISVKFHLK